VLDPEIEDAEDVRMRERGDRLRLALESRVRGRIGGERSRQNLDGDVAIQLRVTRDRLPSSRRCRAGKRFRTGRAACQL